MHETITHQAEMNAKLMIVTSMPKSQSQYQIVSSYLIIDKPFFGSCFFRTFSDGQMRSVDEGQILQDIHNVTNIEIQPVEPIKYTFQTICRTGLQKIADQSTNANEKKHA